MNARIWTVGANSACDIVIDLPWVSGTHCRLLQQDGRIEIEDLGSRNGTFVNGVRIARARLSTSDHVMLGSRVTLPWAELVEASSDLGPRIPFGRLLLIAAVAFAFVVLSLIRFNQGASSDSDDRVAAVDLPMPLPKKVSASPVESALTTTADPASFVLSVTATNERGEEVIIGHGWAVSPNTVVTTASILQFLDEHGSRIQDVHVRNGKSVRYRVVGSVMDSEFVPMLRNLDSIEVKTKEYQRRYDALVADAARQSEASGGDAATSIEEIARSAIDQLTAGLQELETALEAVVSHDVGLLRIDGALQSWLELSDGAVAAIDLSDHEAPFHLLTTEPGKRVPFRLTIGKASDLVHGYQPFEVPSARVIEEHAGCPVVNGQGQVIGMLIRVHPDSHRTLSADHTIVDVSRLTGLAQLCKSGPLKLTNSEQSYLGERHE